MSGHNPSIETPVWQESGLQTGFVHDWLVAGPLATAVPDMTGYTGPSRFRIDHPGPISGINQLPVECQKFIPYCSDEATELEWRLVRCLEDHFIHLSTWHAPTDTPMWTWLQAWAYCVLDSSSTQHLALALTTNGPADVWINNEHTQRMDHHQSPQTVSFPAQLNQGRNEILVRFEAVAPRACPYVMALQIRTAGKNEEGLSVDKYSSCAPAITVSLPTSMRPTSRRQTLESIFDKAYLDREVFTRQEQIVVHWPEGEPVKDNFAVRLERKDGRIYSEQHTNDEERAEAVLGMAYQFPEDDYQVLLFPHPEEYYVHGLRVERRLDIHIVSNNTYSSDRYDTYQKRRDEALWNAAQRRNNADLFSEIATMELGRWASVNEQVLLDSINRRAAYSDLYLVGLLGMAGRYIEDPAFPQALIEPLRTCFLNFRWLDEPRNDLDAHTPESSDIAGNSMYFRPENTVTVHTCEILAGQLLPDERFPNTGLTGAQHRAQGERMALSWLRKRAMGGFPQWDSHTAFEENVLALSHLVDLAENDDVRELAAVVLDKMFFGLAVNSFKGVFGSTQGHTSMSYVKDAYKQPTSGISRLLWGKGIFNQHILGTVSLACAVNYQLPPLIEAIALDPAEEIWNQERHAGQLDEWCNGEDGEWEINKVTYKTPDYMLASAQDYRPGEPGSQQHIWQATLSPEAVVFVTHPPYLSEDSAHRPNFWHGNVILPRVAQWKDLLVAIHQLPADDWLGFTHAYFPIYAFDEYKIQANWAFARVKDGYLAITASAGLKLIKSGQNAFRELRAYGQNNMWLVQMGRAAMDGSFAEFMEKVTALDITFDEDSVHLTGLREQSIDFGWEGPLLINEKEQQITGFLHFDNPYSMTELGAKKMDIQFQDLLVRLDFS